jgi:integrase
MLQLVAAKSPDLLATAVLGGFAGLRRSELITQDWSDVDLSKKVLRVTGAKAGTPSRRLVPICDAAVAWLLLCAERKGKIGGATLTPAPDRLRKLCRDQEGEGKIDLPENAARHSYISHRVAVLGNVSEVALEAGNSPQIIHRHYRELVTKAEGAAWFAVEPGKEAEVIGMDGKRVAS